MRRINLSAPEDDQPVAAAIIERSRDQNGVGTGSARSVNIAYLLSGIPMSALGRCCRRSRRLSIGMGFCRDLQCRSQNGGWPEGSECEGFEVLHDRGEVELVSCTGKTSEPHSFEAVVDLQVSKAHFDTLTFVT